jgi:DUF177 domain-containing protein
MTEFEFVVPAHDLDAAGKPYRFSVRAPWIRGALEDTGVQPAGSDGELDVRLSKSGADVVLRGVLTVELSVPCARCLQPAPVRVREPLSALFVTALSPGEGSNEEGADELTLDDADVNAYDGETVVLDGLVRDELLLSIPMIPLCSENCPGISPETPSEPAASSGIDPRLRPLLRLKKNLT